MSAGAIETELVWTGLDCTGLGKTGLDWTSLPTGPRCRPVHGKVAMGVHVVIVADGAHMVIEDNIRIFEICISSS